MSFPLISVGTDGRIVLHCGAEDDSTLLMVVIMMMAPRGIAVLQRKGGRQQQTIPLGGDPPQFMLRWELTMLPGGIAGYFFAIKQSNSANNMQHF